MSTYLHAAVYNSFTRRTTKSFLWGFDILQACGTSFCWLGVKLGREGSTTLFSSGELLRKVSECAKVDFTVEHD